MYQLSTGFTIQTIDACFDTCRNAPYMYMTQVSFTFTHSLIVTQTVRVCILHIYTHRYLVQPPKVSMYYLLIMVMCNYTTPTAQSN